MVDLALDWNDDLVVDDNGDFLLVDGVPAVVQRVVRRFLTNSATLDLTTGLASRPPDYLFSPDYGGNARAYVDSVVNAELLSRIQYSLLAQLAKEPDVSPAQSTITVTPQVNGVTLDAQIAVNTGFVFALPAVAITP